MLGCARKMRGYIPVIVALVSIVLAPIGCTALSSGNGQSWIGTFGYGLTRLDNSGWRTWMGAKPDLPSDQIKDIAAGPDNRVWIVHSLGVTVTDGRTWQTIKNGWGFGSPECAACDAAGGLWLGYYGGVAYYNANGWTTYPAKLLGSGANVNSVKDIAIDRNGAVWVLTANSAARFADNNWTYYEKGLGWDKDYYFTKIATDTKGRVWAGHGTGIIMFDGTKWVKHESANLSQIQCLATDAKDRVWAGTYAKGLSMFDGRDWKTFNRANTKLSSDHVSAVVVDAGDRLWIGTEWGLNILDGSDWRVYHMSDADLADNTIYTLATIGDGPPLPAPKQKTPGSLTGRLVKDSEPLAGMSVEIGTEFLGMFFTGSTPFADNPYSRLTTTDQKGGFAFAKLPVGRYSIAFKGVNGKWRRLTDAYGIGDKKVEIKEGQVTDLPVIDLK